MSASPKHLLHFEGGNALSAFRAQALLARLTAACARITGLSARHVHWAWSDAPLAGGERDKLAALLAYGGVVAPAPDGALVVVMPRLGTVSSASPSSACRSRPACSVASRWAPTSCARRPSVCTIA